MDNNRISEIIEKLRAVLEKKFPSGLVSRQKVGEATDYILHPGTCANLDCLNSGIANPVRIGRRIFYRIEDLLDFIQAQM